MIFPRMFGCLFSVTVLLVATNASAIAEPVELASPDGRITAQFLLSDQGEPQYQVQYQERDVIVRSNLGLTLKDHRDLDRGFVIESKSARSHTSTWQPLAGERSTIHDHYNEMIVGLKQSGDDAGRLDVHLRAYNEGFAVSYTVPEQEHLSEFVISDEQTEFRFKEDYFCWDTKDAQGLYFRVPISKVGRGAERPLVVEMEDGPYVALGEARMVDYSRMRFQTSPKDKNTLIPDLAGEVSATASFSTPWRYVMIADSPGQLLENNDLVLNLNEPCAIADTSWIVPGKAIRSELNTARCKATIDWAVEMNARYLLIDAGWYGPERDNASDATTVTVDPNRKSGPFDLHEVIAYAKTRQIGVILYVNHRALEQQLDVLLPLYKKWGVAGIKFGFVNVGEQKWTNWLHDAIAKCAEYQLVVDVHDDYRPTGWSRTYPNLLTQEGIKGNETMPTAEENVILPFTRYLCGPADYTVCYYSGRLKTTRAHQLAASIVYFSPLQLIFWYDKPAQYRGERELDVFKQVPTKWDETHVLHGEIGKYVTIARRDGDRWFVGSMNAGEQRSLEIPLSFLESGTQYTVSIHADGHPDGTNKTKVSNSSRTVSRNTILTAEMAANGGHAVVLTPLK
ncbi:glycoside hydrolase family 97 protein [Rhodopirellula sallentina]|nr:glycoside hydrolase family 97 protein [Rhodopirellula sallentina]